MTTPTASESPYQSYVYAYPHKTAYRPLPDRPPLTGLWRGEKQDALSLYLHIPFCEVRCGFCNLFTRIGSPEGLTTAYLDALERQAGQVREALAGDARFALAAFGGGTPTYLTASELERLCDIAEHRMGADLTAIPLSVEASPDTATADRLRVLAERGTTRLSLGVQSFLDEEAKSAVRPQKRAAVEAALGRVRDAGFPVLNIDLIYGIDGQTVASWIKSLDAALSWRPEELYLYPLYVRPLTGLGRHTAPASTTDGTDGGTTGDTADWDAQRLTLYRAGRDHLLANGYQQVSMRMFRRTGGAAASTGEYACQTDGMVGLGCGARSYTSKLHYSFDYAVDAREVRRIIDDYVAAPDFSRAELGWEMTDEETRRRHLVQSLLQGEGVDLTAYRERFGSTPEQDFPAELAEFAAHGWLADDARNSLLLSPEGLAWSDAIGPRLFSAGVRARMTEYSPK
ncbi:STM4012 family radical SAM protein [Kitasatospora sp. NPDC059795]|uniref:STM4012 family radical SAM protein n=1 Tax=Kitasatospora sp. NPDC059795 TaxID=3346949 RepID=UPI003656BE77